MDGRSEGPRGPGDPEFEDAWSRLVEGFHTTTESSAPQTSPPDVTAPEAPTDPAPGDVASASGDEDQKVEDHAPEHDVPPFTDEPVEVWEQHLPDDPGPGWAPVEEDRTRFVPPVPPPLPTGPPLRRAAWWGLIGAPTLLVLVLFSGWRPPPLFGYLLVAVFLGSFGYLVATMGEEPRDPWDDGSRV